MGFHTYIIVCPISQLQPERGDPSEAQQRKRSNASKASHASKAPRSTASLQLISQSSKQAWSKLEASKATGESRLSVVCLNSAESEWDGIGLLQDEWKCIWLVACSIPYRAAYHDPFPIDIGFPPADRCKKGSEAKKKEATYRRARKGRATAFSWMGIRVWPDFEYHE